MDDTFVVCTMEKCFHFCNFFLFFKCNQKVKSIIVTEVTVRSPFITDSFICKLFHELSSYRDVNLSPFHSIVWLFS